MLKTLKGKVNKEQGQTSGGCGSRNWPGPWFGREDSEKANLVPGEFDTPKDIRLNYVIDDDISFWRKPPGISYLLLSLPLILTADKF